MLGDIASSPEQGFYEEKTRKIRLCDVLGAVSISRLGVWLQMEATEKENKKMIGILNPND